MSMTAVLTSIQQVLPPMAVSVARGGDLSGEVMDVEEGSVGAEFLGRDG